MVPIIVELHGDGFVQVFGPEHVRAVVINRIDDNGPAAIAPDLANLADAFHELELPRSHRPFYVPVHVRATGLVRQRTPEGDRRRAEKLKFVQETRAIREELIANKKVKASA